MVACTSMPSYEPETNDEYIEQLEAQSDQEIKAETLRTYTYAGIAMLVAGVSMIAFTSRYKSGLIFAVTGAIVMAFPFIFNSKWFDWVFGISIALILLDGLWFLFRFTAKYINNKANAGTKADGDK